MRSSAKQTKLTLDDYLRLEYPFDVTADEDDGGYVVEFPDLPGCMTQVDSLVDLGVMAEEAKNLWLETAFEAGMEIPLPSYPETYSGRFNVRLPKSLHRRLAESAAREGISLNQQVVSMLSESIATYTFEERLVDVEVALGIDNDAKASEGSKAAVDAVISDPRSLFESSE